MSAVDQQRSLLVVQLCQRGQLATNYLLTNAEWGKIGCCNSFLQSPGVLHLLAEFWLSADQWDTKTLSQKLNHMVTSGMWTLSSLFQQMVFLLSFG